MDYFITFTRLDWVLISFYRNKYLYDCSSPKILYSRQCLLRYLKMLRRMFKTAYPYMLIGNDLGKYN